MPYSPGAANKSLKWQACLDGLALLAKRSGGISAEAGDRAGESAFNLFNFDASRERSSSASFANGQATFSSSVN